MLNGFMIFLIATDCPVNSSFAELAISGLHERTKRIPYETECSHSDGLKIDVPTDTSAIRFAFPRRRGKRREGHYLLVISKQVPNICALTNSAISRSKADDSPREI